MPPSRPCPGHAPWQPKSAVFSSARVPHAAPFARTCAPVVANDHRLGDVQVVQQGRNVGRERRGRCHRNRNSRHHRGGARCRHGNHRGEIRQRGLRRAASTAHHDAEARRRQGADLIPPPVPQLRRPFRPRGRPSRPAVAPSANAAPHTHTHTTPGPPPGAAVRAHGHPASRAAGRRFSARRPPGHSLHVAQPRPAMPQGAAA